jgi:hypothetical protein
VSLFHLSAHATRDILQAAFRGLVMESETFELHANTYFDWVQSLLIPAKLALLSIFLGGAASRGIWHYWIILSGFFLIFTGVFAVPLYLFVSYVNHPEVFVSGGAIRIAPQSGFAKGWMFPVGSIRWNVTANNQLYIYPFSYFAFARSAGTKPFRIRLKVSAADIDKWTTALRGSEKNLISPLSNQA